MDRDRSLERPQAGAGSSITQNGSANLLRHDHEFSERLRTRKRGLALWLGDKADKKVAEFDSKMVEQQGASELEKFRMYHEYQRQALKAALDRLLLEGKVHTDHWAAEFYERHKHDLDRVINTATVEYLKEIDQLLTELENAKLRASLRERVERMIWRRIDEYESAVNILMDRFAKIPSGGV